VCIFTLLNVGQEAMSVHVAIMKPWSCMDHGAIGHIVIISVALKKVFAGTLWCELAISYLIMLLYYYIIVSPSSLNHMLICCACYDYLHSSLHAYTLFTKTIFL
jgi:hypothetical protein